MTTDPLIKITKSNRFPLANIQEIFDTIGNAKIDLKSGYHQFRNGSELNTLALSPFGHYEWFVMPFGLTNAPSTFQSWMIFFEII